MNPVRICTHLHEPKTPVNDVMMGSFTHIDMGFGTLLFGLLLLISIIDLRTFRLPNMLNLALIIFGFIYAYMSELGLLHSVIGAIIGYGFFVLVEVSFKKLRGIDGLGRGDAKLLAVGGAWCGWIGLPYIVLFGSLLGIIAALLPVFKSHEKGWVPFGPFLALGIFIIWLAQRLAGV